MSRPGLAGALRLKQRRQARSLQLQHQNHVVQCTTSLFILQQHTNYPQSGGARKTPLRNDRQARGRRGLYVYNRSYNPRLRKPSEETSLAPQLLRYPLAPDHGGGEHATLLDDELRRSGGAMPMMMMKINLVPCTFCCSFITSILGCRFLWSRHLTIQCTSMLRGALENIHTCLSS
jgi:hypothetical protein